jgi:acetyl-CoA/propionyl-CoA carboxylase biotin carboxyl carrier protein
MQGTVVAAAVADGDRVAEGDLVVVLEAMKMEQQIRAHRAGTVRRLAAEAGATLAPGAVICDIED